MDFKQSEEFNSRLLAEYKDGMQDMQAGFTLTNPTLTAVDWSFMLEMSGETVAEGEGSGAAEEGEVTGVGRELEAIAETTRVVWEPQVIAEATRAVQELEEIVIIDEPEPAKIPEQSHVAVSDLPAGDLVLPGQLD